jgi:glycerol-3-phosphate dehydrogenase
MSGKILYGALDDFYEESLKFDEAKLKMPYDVAIIGAGLVGTALAYKLSQYDVSVVLVDKNYDVGEATSKGSSAIIHTGFDAPVGTLESELVTKAALEWPELAKKLKIPMEKCGAIVLAVNKEQEEQLEKVYEKGIKNGVKDIKLLSAKEVKEIEPNVSEDVLGGVLVPRESIADPFTSSIAFAEVAMKNGTDIVLGAEIIEFENLDDEVKTIVTAEKKRIRAKIIVNVAGLGSEFLAKLYGGEDFDTNPRRGQFLIFDKFSNDKVKRILLPIPTAKTKGVLVAPTIFGNLIAGPTAEDFEHQDKFIAETRTEDMKAFIDGASKLFPKLKEQPRIGIFAGVRSNCKQGSYWIRFNDNHKGVVTVAGIRSTGFTSCPALATHLIDKLKSEVGLKLKKRVGAVDDRKDTPWPGWWEKPYDNNELVKENPDYGKIVCFCEQISKGDIIRHLKSPLKPLTLDSVKRRTRAQMGRCQGFDCMARVAKIISDFWDIPLEKVTKKGTGTEITSPLISKNQ